MEVLEVLDRELANIVKAVIGADALEDSGKKKPAKYGKLKPLKADEESFSDEQVEESDETSKGLFVEFAKANEEEQIVSGIVLQPEVTDAQGDIISAEVIKEAAYGFLAGFGKKTKLGLQHNSFSKKEARFTLAESYIAPMDFVLGTTPVKAGSWIMTWKILDKKLWAKVKEGKITGFSIGGKARAVQLKKS